MNNINVLYVDNIYVFLFPYKINYKYLEDGRLWGIVCVCVCVCVWIGRNGKYREIGDRIY